MKNIKEMTLKEKIGQLILPGFHSYEYDEQLTAFKAVKKAVEENIISVDTLKDKVRRINRYKEKLLNILTKEYVYRHFYFFFNFFMKHNVLIKLENRFCPLSFWSLTN